jgi:hypothetical protein
MELNNKIKKLIILLVKTKLNLPRSHKTIPKIKTNLSRNNKITLLKTIMKTATKFHPQTNKIKQQLKRTTNIKTNPTTKTYPK